ncbi:MAG TPA: glycosyltransferase family 39 protein, partial [Thermomicrobiales bacterium]|nr:glycosyltransferase family 39 protein [Thermomicrobiales bacterium]
MPAVLRAWLRSVAHPLACAFLAFCVAGLWGAVVPLGEAPDEPGHYDYIVSVMRGDLPALEMPTTPEAFQPPLAYVVAAALARPFSAPHPSALELNPTASFNPDTPRTPFFKALFHHPPEQNRPWQGWVRLWHLLRMVSAGWLALAAFATFLTARRLFPRSPALWPLVVGVTTLLPQQVFIGMTVSNDPASLALAALAVWALVVAWQDKPGTRTALLFGLLAGLLMLTKLSLAPLTLALVVMPAVWRRNWTWAAASGLVGGLLWLPWAARLWRHDGDPTGQRANLDLHPTLRPPDDLTLAFWQDMLRTTEASIWGRFGWMNVGTPVDVYRPATL